LCRTHSSLIVQTATTCTSQNLPTIFLVRSSSFIAKPFHNHFNHHLSSLIRIRLYPNRNKGFEFSKNIMEIEEDAHLMDEFSYEDDDVRCSVNYELHVAFSERRRIRIGSSSVVRYTIRWMPKAVIFFF
ncbi:hypothetical protein LINPERHAP1_LOCUS13159, partial [Linum perenne]